MITNKQNLPLSVALYLAADEYDHNSDPDYLSATSIIKSDKIMVLSKRVGEVETDVSSIVASRIGTAIHDAIERAWTSSERRSNALAALGIPPKVFNKILINPKPEDLYDGCIPIYMEQRRVKKINGMLLGGKFDFIGEGQLEDFKSTKTYGYIHGTNVQDYILQGSIYRWLFPDLVTENTILITYVFTDWMAGKAKTDPSYPQTAVLSEHYPLMSMEETEEYLTGRTQSYLKLRNLDEADLPECTPEDLWQKPSKWKYYKNPEKRTKSTKNFDDEASAIIRMQDDGNVGIVIEDKGSVMRCKYCNGFDKCTQKDIYLKDGSLEL